MKARLCREEGGALSKRLIMLRVAAEANRNMDAPQLQKRIGRLSRWRRVWTQKSNVGGRCSRYLPSYPPTETSSLGAIMHSASRILPILVQRGAGVVEVCVSSISSKSGFSL